jgi:hypothetical protein
LPSSECQAYCERHYPVESRQNLTAYADPQQSVAEVVRAANPGSSSLSQAADNNECGVDQRDSKPRQRGAETSFRSVKHDCRAEQKAAAIAHEDTCGRIVEAKKSDARTGAGQPGITAKAERGGCDRARGKTVGMIKHVDRIAGDPNDDRHPPKTCDEAGKYRRGGQRCCLGTGGKGSDIIKRADKAEKSQQEDMANRKPWGHRDQ